MVRHAAFIAAVLAIPTLARAQPDMMAQARAAAANQLGIMEYCESKGFAGADAVTAQREAMARLPGGGDSGDAEAQGKEGTMLAGTQRLPLADIAARQHVEIPALCRQMADAAVRTATMLKQNGMSAGGIPGLPAMTGMPTVPGVPPMPGGMPMPGVMPGVMPGGMPGVMPGAMPGAMPAK